MPERVSSSCDFRSKRGIDTRQNSIEMCNLACLNVYMYPSTVIPDLRGYRIEKIVWFGMPELNVPFTALRFFWSVIVVNWSCLWIFSKSLTVYQKYIITMYIAIVHTLSITIVCLVRWGGAIIHGKRHQIPPSLYMRSLHTWLVDQILQNKITCTVTIKGAHSSMS